MKTIERKKVLCGADRLSEISTLLKGKRCGLLTSASGIDSKGIPTYFKLHSEWKLTVLFAPEHGIHSVLQDGGWSGEYIDHETGVPVYDLPARGNPKIDDALSLCDVVLYDIQDVGARFYTYIYCLTYLMKECAARSVPIVILDRPDPIGADMDYMEGAILDENRFSSFVGRYAIPVRYCMTCGEFARYINDEKEFGCELYVIECQGYTRDIFFDDTLLPWVNPSPNIPTVSCAINYIGTCLIEGTNVSEGRGTTRPFDIVGAPYVDSRQLCDMMNRANLDGVFFSRAFFTPMFGKWQGQACEGVQFNIIDRRSYRPHSAGLHLLASLREFDEFEWRENGICLRYGRDTLTCNEIFDPTVVLKDEADDVESFKMKIKKYLIY